MKNIIVIVSLVVLSGCHTMNLSCGLEDDNICEEISEDMLRGRTGIVLDFTPDTPEPLVP